MDFGTFLLYFVLAVVVLFIGYWLVCFLIGLTAHVTMRASDAAATRKRQKAERKWEAIEEGLEEDE